MTLPLPLPMTAQAAAVVRRRLRAMQEVVQHVGVENNVAYFTLGDPADEPRFLDACLNGDGFHLLLDVHNVHTMAVNHGLDPIAYLDELPLERVIEIHVSGGNDSEAQWLPSRRVLRLDSHDRAVPDEVWHLLDEALARTPNLRGVTLERMEGTVESDDVPVLSGELARIRRAIAARKLRPALPKEQRPLADEALPPEWERALVDIHCAADPETARRAWAADRRLPAAFRRRLAAADEDGLRISALLVVRLRFERLLRGSLDAETWFEEDGASFAAAFRRYHAEVSPLAFFPMEEAELFAKWCETNSNKID